MEATCSPDTSVDFNGLRGIISQKTEVFLVIYAVGNFVEAYICMLHHFQFPSLTVPFVQMTFVKKRSETLCHLSAC
jgi:hypothetical protein